MAAVYPTSLVSFSAITDGTLIDAALFTERAEEIEAVMTELGVLPFGSAGSLSERIRMALDEDGGAYGFVQDFDAADTERRRCRAGIELVNVDDLTVPSEDNFARGTVTYGTAFQNNTYAFVAMQTLASDNTSDTIPALVNFLNGTGTTTQFEFAVSNGLGFSPEAGSQFILHWWAIERNANTDSGID